VPAPLEEQSTVGTELRAYVARAMWTIRLLWATFLFWGVAVLFVPRDLDQYGQGTFSVTYRLLNFLTYVPVLMMGFTALRAAIRPLREYQRSKSNDIALLIAVVACAMLVIGVVSALDSPGAVRVIWLEALPVCALLLFMNGRDLPFTKQSLYALVALQAAIGALVAAYVLALYPIIDTRGQINGAHALAFGLLAPTTLAVLLVPTLLPWQRMAAALGYSASIAMSVAYQGRLQALMQFGVLPLAWCLVQIRCGTASIAVRRAFAPLLAIGLLVSAVVIWSPAIRQQFEAGVEGTLGRLSDTKPLYEASSSSEQPEERWIEAAEFVRGATWKTWLLGEGIGGTWRSAHMAGDLPDNKWPMVHFGPLHLVLKGGLPFLVVFHLLLAVVVLRLWRMSKYDYLSGAILAYVVIAYIGFLSHGPLLHRYGFYFTWTLVGAAFTNALPDQGSSSRRRSRYRLTAKLAHPRMNGK
jgi:hypothetical protein